MNEAIINDALRHQNVMLAKLTELLEASYLQTQELEANKTPNESRPYTVNLSCPSEPNLHPLQVLGRNPNRSSLTIYNVGAGSCFYHHTMFDPTSILQQFSDPANPNTVLPAYNQVVQIGYLPSGASVTINSTEPLWALNHGATCLLTIIESVYAKAGKQQPGFDGVLGNAYAAAEVSGATLTSKGLV